ncbi:glycoside hydrolase family 97 catalytic domain-containing protein [Gilvimarinus sp. SDUM040013]|uniref:Glycoside hydrolase family 97 catalytic domain-containing protein n=1 Tax=Gilvimarinus gilvus TaxID=3058038 RepID=A0ABU4S137_9GAMM|nr:glycoside hydrolase family 97 protein [Gilvimarinus sp. SDUM040013]MDO3387245.1 glycoside hydrolase family 97 catalytic domain-containing protein [Gilvimarinus sp. SDUM040013]MDX6848934.1 glycoside hydrolase family 97 catalytic domain-containing protein [Gilvimarinus sp. SDUM040013]
MKFRLLAILALAGCGADQTYTLSSPNGEVQLSLQESTNGGVEYSLTHRDNVVLEPSALGLTLSDAEFNTGLSVQSVGNVEYVSEPYTMSHGKQRDITYQANEQVFKVENAQGDVLTLAFRVSDNGLSFQYQIPNAGQNSRHVVEEHTSFDFTPDSKAWLQPVAVAQTGFANTNPSYEEHYQMDIPVGTASPTEAGWVFPSLFYTGHDWVLIGEAGMQGDFHASRLAQNSPEGEYQIGKPMAPEVITGGELMANSDEALTSPWRIIAVGDLATVTESTLGTDLAAPAVGDMPWAKPGLAAWSWALLKDDSVNFDTTMEFIDYAADMGWPYVLIDANWDRNIGWEKLAELVDYAEEKNVGVLVWYNSSGEWNTTEMTPKSQLVDRTKRLEHFARLHEVGVKGVKIDFFPGDGQSVMQYYNDLLSDAADYELLLNYHGSSLPRGLHRTYPNMMTMESVHGFEMITFMQASADKAASHMAMLPFTRNVFDPMDFTPTTFDEIPNIERKTSNGFELALPVLFTSGIQHIAETPAGMAKVPDFVKEYMRDIPTLWDETRLVTGSPGEYAVVARRRGSDWFVAGINGTDAEVTLNMDLTFIASEGQMITDGDDDRSFSRRDVSAAKAFKLTVRPRGGFVINF